MTVQPPGDRPAPGYYPDPSIPGFVRYWDGDGWTPGSARPAPTDGVPLPPPPRASSRGPLRVAPPPPPRAEETGPVFLDETGAAALTVPAAPEYGAGAAATVWNASPEAQHGLLEPEVPRWVSWGVPDEAPPAVSAASAVSAALTASADASAEVEAQPAVPTVPARAGGGHSIISGALDADADGDDELASALRLALSQTRRAHLPPVSYYEAEAWADPHQGHAQPSAPVAGTAPSVGLPAAPLPAAPLPPAQAGARQPSGWEGTGHPSFGNLMLPPEPAAPPAPPSALLATPTLPRGDERDGAVTDSQALSVGGLPVAERGPAVKPATERRPAPTIPTASTAPTIPSLSTTPTIPTAPTVPQAPRRTARPSADASSTRVRASQPKARPALLGPRLGARLLDTVVAYALVGVLAVVLVQRVVLHLQAKINAAQVSGSPQTVWLLDGTVLANAGILLAALLAVGVVYEAIPTAAWGRTLGKAVFGLRVLDSRTRQRPGLGRCLLRTAVAQTSVFVLLGVLELIPCATDRRLRQSWHDKLARTFVAKR
ncbi:RDD family protein [Streptacidiphilus sp. MAP5-3]|uniref:RDD family protein n=1 Tax=unclassified Streptacidiphilus TaxID=2643834 RepID=UPI003517DB5B